MKALIDGDIIAYSIGFASQKNVHIVSVDGEVVGKFNYKKDLNEFLEGLEEEYTVTTEVEAEPVSFALHSVKQFIKSVLEAVEADDYTVYLTGSGNFREEIATILPYKGNRVAPKPVHYQAIRDYLVDRYGAVVVDGMEADDQLSLDQSEDYQDNVEFLRDIGSWPDEPSLKRNCSTVICSIDKDLMMVPGWHYNWNKDEKVWVSEEQGMYNFYMQLLTGDPTDNIQGIPGIGKKKAERILEGMGCEQSMFYSAVTAYEEYLYSVHKQQDDGTESYHEWIREQAMKNIIENGQLLWMVRELDEEGKPVMWSPPV